jgi:hypothetical protein
MVKETEEETGERREVHQSPFIEKFVNVLKRRRNRDAKASRNTFVQLFFLSSSGLIVR